MRRLLLRLLPLLAALFLAGVGTAGPASAHAELVSTDPGEGARLDGVPSRVTLQFSEGVSLGAGYARVLDAGGVRVDSGSASVDGDAVTIPLRTTRRPGRRTRSRPRGSPSPARRRQTRCGRR